MINIHGWPPSSSCLYDHLTTAWPGGNNAVNTGESGRQMSQSDVCQADARFGIIGGKGG